MAGDWIKMRSNLWDDPRVGRLCDITGEGEAAVVGGLYWLWAAADQHTEDGYMVGLSLRQIDRKTGIKDFGAALIAIGWIAEESDGVRVVNFDDHNGASAKRRSTDAKRKSSVRKMSASDADKVRTNCGGSVELEKEKEKEKSKDNTPPVPPQGGKPKRAAQLPENFEPTENNKRLAQELGVSLGAEFPKFCDYHRAKGSTMKDWGAALNNWIRNANKFDRSDGRKNQPAKETPRERAVRMAAERGIPNDQR